jgi:lipoprotein-anchoring transpeptidase ErfK/SrfK
MPDTIEERLAQLGTSLEDATGIGSPAAIRNRGNELRVAHRHRVVAMTAATAAVVVIAAGSAVALRAGGHQPKQISPGSTVSPSVSAPPSTEAPTSPALSGAPAVEAPAAVVDLKQHKMTITKNGQVVRTIPVSAGIPAHPTATGTFTVAAKLDAETLSSSPTSDAYTMKAQWVIKLDANGPQMLAAPWAEAKIGKIDGSHGDIEMRTADAKWLYGQLAVGDRVVIQ